MCVAVDITNIDILNQLYVKDAVWSLRDHTMTQWYGINTTYIFSVKVTIKACSVCIIVIFGACMFITTDFPVLMMTWTWCVQKHRACNVIGAVDANNMQIGSTSLSSGYILTPLFLPLPCLHFGCSCSIYDMRNLTDSEEWDETRRDETRRRPTNTE